MQSNQSTRIGHLLANAQEENQNMKTKKSNDSGSGRATKGFNFLLAKSGPDNSTSKGHLRQRER